MSGVSWERPGSVPEGSRIDQSRPKGSRSDFGAILDGLGSNFGAIWDGFASIGGRFGFAFARACVRACVHACVRSFRFVRCGGRWAARALLLAVLLLTAMLLGALLLAALLLRKKKRSNSHRAVYLCDTHVASK